jgi:hypothetical protein
MLEEMLLPMNSGETPVIGTLWQQSCEHATAKAVADSEANFRENMRKMALPLNEKELTDAVVDLRNAALDLFNTTAVGEQDVKDTHRSHLEVHGCSNWSRPAHFSLSTS